MFRLPYCYFLHISRKGNYQLFRRSWKFYFLPLIIKNQLPLVLLFCWSSNRKKGCRVFFSKSLPQSSLFSPPLLIVKECSAFLSVRLLHLLIEREVFQNVMLPRHYLLWQLPGKNIDDIRLGLPDNG